MTHLLLIGLLSFSLASNMFLGDPMTEYPLQRANASFPPAVGRVNAPEREIALLTSRGEFSAYLADPFRFFDGRFAYYEEFEGEDGAFFREHDLIAVIVRGRAERAACALADGIWQVKLFGFSPDPHPALYWISVPKGGTGAVFSA